MKEVLDNQSKDWRLKGQERYLKDKKLCFKKYKKKSETLEHEHCEFCFQKIIESCVELSDCIKQKHIVHEMNVLKEWVK